MECPVCGAANRNGGRFCTRCGEPLALSCPRCRAARSAEDRFCAQCGEPFAAPALRAPGPRAEGGERRQLTVLFCDIVGSTRLAHARDPEDWQGLLGAYREACSGAVGGFGGHVAQHLGDGLLAYFGFPAALEDAPDRAAHAALAILEAMAETNARIERSGGPRLPVRVAIHTGPVVIASEGSGAETLAIGDTPNLAAHLQGVAEPDTIVLSEQTRRLLGPDFAVEEVGEREIKGRAQPVRVHRLVGSSRSHSDEPEPGDRTPLIGRAHELERLVEAFDLARSGAGAVASISAEPGVGKSRLVRALRSELAATPHGWIHVRCSPYEQNSSLAALAPWLSWSFGWKPDDSSEERMSKLEHALRDRGCTPEDIVPVAATALPIDLPNATTEGAPRSASSEKRHRLALDGLVSYMIATAAERPTVVTFEDLHWSDGSTRGLIEHLLPRLADTPVLLVLTWRSGFEAPWTLPSESVEIELAHLSDRDAGALVAGVAKAGGATLSDATVARIVQRADGVPLFLEELAKTIIETGGDAEEVGEERIPASLQDSLAARLDRLGDGRAIAQLAAVLGRDFGTELLEAVADLDREALAAPLGDLVEAELLLPVGARPHTRYVFNHALVQDAAYESLLRGRRRELHRRVADELESHFPELVARQPELVAHHCTRAGETRRAIDHWGRAAGRARASYASADAIAHTEAALRLLSGLPDSPERDAEELSLQLALGGVLVASKGMGSADVEGPHLRALELARARGEPRAEFGASVALTAHYTQRAKHEKARAIARELIELASRAGDPRGSALAQAMLSASLLWCGEIQRAVEHTEKALAHFEEIEGPRRGSIDATEPSVVCFGQRALLLWCVGQPDLALDEAGRLVELVDPARDSASSRAWALNFRTQILLYRREPEALAASAAELRELAEAHDFHRQRAWGFSLGACAGILRGDVEASCAALEAALGEYGDEEAGFWRSLCLGFLALGYGRLGDRARALEHLAHAQQHVERTGEAFFEADLFRIRGDLLRTTSDGAHEAESCYRRAVDHARKRGALGFELRAAVALASLLRERNDASFRDELARCYERFDEGHTTPDLRDARALLEG